MGDGLRQAALALLARREHSRRELALKLARRGWPEGEIEAALETLARENMQSDARFAESYARVRAERAYGPVRIRAELQARGVGVGEIDAALHSLDVDWAALAADWYQRRHADHPPDTPRVRARRQQALLRRGFTHEHLRALFR